MTLFEKVPFLLEALLFVLVYVIVFAILQKSKILGEKVPQMNSLVALVIAFIFVGFSWANDIVSNIIPFVAIALVILLMFFLLYGFVGGEVGQMNSKIKYSLIFIASLFLIIVVFYVTGFWKLFSGFNIDSSFVYSAITLVLVLVAIIYVIVSSKGN